jgi:hypothetical protein
VDLSFDPFMLAGPSLLAVLAFFAVLALFFDHHRQEEHKEYQTDTDGEAVPEVIAHHL